MEVRYSAHSVYRTQYHVVFVTKFRRNILTTGFAAYADRVIRGVVERMEGVEIEELNVRVEHVHMVANIPPRYAVSKVIEAVKSQSAKEIRNKFEWIDKVYWGTRSLWSKGYFVSTVGLNEKTIRNYVKYQQKRDAGQAKLEV